MNSDPVDGDVFIRTTGYAVSNRSEVAVCAQPLVHRVSPGPLPAPTRNRENSLYTGSAKRAMRRAKPRAGTGWTRVHRVRRAGRHAAGDSHSRRLTRSYARDVCGYNTRSSPLISPNEAPFVRDVRMSAEVELRGPGGSLTWKIKSRWTCLRRHTGRVRRTDLRRRTRTRSTAPAAAPPDEVLDRAERFASERCRGRASNSECRLSRVRACERFDRPQTSIRADPGQPALAAWHRARQFRLVSSNLPSLAGNCTSIGTSTTFVWGRGSEPGRTIRSRFRARSTSCSATTVRRASTAAYGTSRVEAPCRRGRPRSAHARGRRGEYRVGNGVTHRSGAGILRVSSGHFEPLIDFRRATGGLWPHAAGSMSSAVFGSLPGQCDRGGRRHRPPEGSRIRSWSTSTASDSFNGYPYSLGRDAGRGIAITQVAPSSVV